MGHSFGIEMILDTKLHNLNIYTFSIRRLTNSTKKKTLIVQKFQKYMFLLFLF